MWNGLPVADFAYTTRSVWALPGLSVCRETFRYRTLVLLRTVLVERLVVCWDSPGVWLLGDSDLLFGFCEVSLFVFGPVETEVASVCRCFLGLMS